MYVCTVLMALLPPRPPPMTRKGKKWKKWKKTNWSWYAADYIEIARIESQIAVYLSHSSPIPSSPPNLHELMPSLLSIIEQADEYPQDIYQARSCLGWLHWTLGEPGVASTRLPSNFAGVVEDIGLELSPWIQVCLIKGCYFKCEYLSGVSRGRDWNEIRMLTAD